MSSDTEVLAKARRRRFSGSYKDRILRQADACVEKGELSALLRREGLYSSHLADWRAVRQQGGLKGLSPKKRGPKPGPPAGVEAKRVAELERQVRRLTARAERAEALVEIQKKVSELLGIQLPEIDERQL